MTLTLNSKDPQYSVEDIKKYEAEIDSLTHEQMARLWRYAPAGHPFFNVRLPLFNRFEQRFFQEFGGMTPEISKEIEKNAQL